MKSFFVVKLIVCTLAVLIKCTYDLREKPNSNSKQNNNKQKWSSLLPAADNEKIGMLLC